MTSQFQILYSGEYRGLEYMVVKNHICICGYIGMNSFEGLVNEDLIYELDVHGGITFNDQLDPNIRLPFMDDDYMWIGFDYGHFDDMDRVVSPNEVLKECKHVIDQIVEFEINPD